MGKVLYRIENQTHGGGHVVASSMEAAIQAWRDALTDQEQAFLAGDRPDDWDGEWPGEDTDFSHEDPDSIRLVDADGIILGS